MVSLHGVRLPGGSAVPTPEGLGHGWCLWPGQNACGAVPSLWSGPSVPK